METFLEENCQSIMDNKENQGRNAQYGNQLKKANEKIRDHTIRIFRSCREPDGLAAGLGKCTARNQCKKRVLSLVDTREQWESQDRVHLKHIQL